MAQTVSIQGLTRIVETNQLSLSTPVPTQKANEDTFKSIALQSIKAKIYATCDTASGTATKVCKLSNFGYVDFFQGIEITIIFENANSADNVTLKFTDPDGNDISGAINLYALNSANLRVGAGAWEAGSRISVEYDGTAFYAQLPYIKKSSTSAINNFNDEILNKNQINGALAEYDFRSGQKVYGNIIKYYENGILKYGLWLPIPHAIINKTLTITNVGIQGIGYLSNPIITKYENAILITTEANISSYDNCLGSATINFN